MQLFVNIRERDNFSDSVIPNREYSLLSYLMTFIAELEKKMNTQRVVHFVTGKVCYTRSIRYFPLAYARIPACTGLFVTKKKCTRILVSFAGAGIACLACARIYGGCQDLSSSHGTV